MSELTKVELLANRQWEGVVAKVEAERDKLRADLAAAQREIAIQKDYAESLVRIVGGKYLFYKERYGVANPTSMELSRIIDDMDNAERRVRELLAQEGVK